MQCLSQTRGLAEPLLEGGAWADRADGADGAETEGSGGRTVAALQHVFRRLRASAEAVAPQDLKGVLAAQVQIFEGYGQQDAQEFLSALLEAVHLDLRRKLLPEPPPPALGGLRPGEMASALWNHSTAVDASPVSDLLQGQLCSRLRCEECGHEEFSFELFWSLPLPVPSASGAMSMAEVMDSFCSEEALDAEWRCERCQRPVRGAKQMSLWRLPPVLQLHLKRFRWEMPAKPSASGPAAAAPQSEAVGPGASTASGDASDRGAATAHAGAAALARSEGVGAEAACLEGPQGSAEGGAAATWEEQERMYLLVLGLLQKVIEAPENPKFRSVGKASSRLRRELLEVEGGLALLAEAGFHDAGDRFELRPELSAEALAERQAAVRASGGASRSDGRKARIRRHVSCVGAIRRKYRRAIRGDV